jgi:hypothetical protein
MADREGRGRHAQAEIEGTPLHRQARYGNLDICRLLIEHGADVDSEDHQKQTPLFDAADQGNHEIVRLLLEHGADPCHHSRNPDAPTALLNMLRHCTRIPREDKAITAEILVDAQRQKGGLPPDERKLAQEYVKAKGHDYYANKESIVDIQEKEQTYDAILGRLYRLFELPSEKPVVKHDGVSPIHVDVALPPNQQFQFLWEYLVPGTGRCQTMQGEVIRIAGRVDDECRRNAGANWDADYQKMLKTLLTCFRYGNALNLRDMHAARKAVRVIVQVKACGGWDETEQLMQLAVKWVRLNPTPYPMGKVDYRR